MLPTLEIEYNPEKYWIHRIFPSKTPYALLIFLLFGLLIWLIGFLLSSDKIAYLKSEEWHIQPIYFAGHLFTTWMFVLPFTKLFEKALKALEGPKEKLLEFKKTVLGIKGLIFGFLFSLPFQIMVVHGVVVGNYDKYFLEETSSFALVDIFMIFIWSLEWFINGYIWFILIGFIILTIFSLKKCDFKGEIEEILLKETYKPFLLLIVQGSTSCLFFCVITSLYVWYAEGDFSDFIGLGLTVLLLITGFTPPWLLLRKKLDKKIDAKMDHFGERLVELDNLKGRITTPIQDIFSEEIALITRIGFLDKLKVELGQKEGRSIVLRLLVPLGTMIWQFIKPFIIG